MTRTLAIAVAMGWLVSSYSAATAADRIVLTPQTWDDAVPAGKEVDAIYGDIVLRNDRVVAAIGQAVPGRNANMTIKNVGGCLIDLTLRGDQSDQLGALYVGGHLVAWQGEAGPDVRGAAEVSVSFRSGGQPGQPTILVEYALADGADHVRVETRYTNETAEPLAVSLLDEIRADGTSFEKVPAGPTPLFWAYDKWWDQAYGILADDAQLSSASDGRLSTLKYSPGGQENPMLKPGETTKLARRIFPARSLLELQSLAYKIGKVVTNEHALEVRDSAGQAIEKAEVAVMLDGQPVGSGRTAADGKLAFKLPVHVTSGKYTAEVTALGSGSKKIDLVAGRNDVALPVAGAVVATIVDERGGPIPCKVAFIGTGGTKDPFLGHMTCEHGVHNLYYSHLGRFEQPLEPGQYDVIVSHGPEYDAEYRSIEIAAGQKTPLAATLRRTIDTRGWISSDFHSHSSPSGDNTASQLGRVLNLLGEHLEFAPCTEHNRISSYDTHLVALGATKLMATCSGMELTGSPLPINHQNAFPLVMTDRTQDGGGPQTDSNPELQIARLALWDSRSVKVVQQNHPDIGHLFFDKDGDGQQDEGFSAGLPFIDVIEVHPPHWIFGGPIRQQGKDKFNNTIFNWLQLLNQGRRLPGVVNTDAHYNFHGSGFLWIYLQSASDDPAEIKTLDVVAAAKAGHIVMTSGPFLEVEASAGADADRRQASGGDDLAAPGGKLTLRVRVQCPNWFDIDRVQVFVNGRPDEQLNFTRERQADRFGSGVVKFDQELPLELAGDAHLIVAAAGEKLQLGPVMGPDHGPDMPIAVSNPIYIDVDGGGFRPNGDTLGAPLPAKNGTRPDTKK